MQWNSKRINDNIYTKKKKSGIYIENFFSSFIFFRKVNNNDFKYIKLIKNLEWNT